MKKRYDYVKDIRWAETVSAVFKGTLIALDMKTKRFKLQLLDGSIMSGAVTDAFLSKGSFEIPKIYDATVDIEKLYTDNALNYKEKFFLKDLYVMP